MFIGFSELWYFYSAMDLTYVSMRKCTWRFQYVNVNFMFFIGSSQLRRGHER